MRIHPALAVSAATLVALTGLACGAGDGKTTSSASGSPAPGVSQQATPGPAKAKMGQTITLTSELLGDVTKVTITLRGAKQAAREPGSFGSKPEKGVYLVVTADIAAVTGTYDANPYSFKFVAADGTVYEPAFATFPPALHSTGLSAGQKTSGTVVFDVPKAALAGARVQVAGIGLDYDEPGAYWAL
jgi:uncharacterized protein DUF4352